jgi:oligopeptide transport system permease protein
VLAVLIAISADVIATHDTSEQFFKRSTGQEVNPLAPRSTGKYELPSTDHLLGTDQLARDIFSRTVVGLRISLAAAFVAILIATVIGVTIGTLSAMAGRLIDDLLMRATDIAFAFPALLLIILLRSALGNELFGRESFLGLEANVLLLFIAIGIASWPDMARLVRGQMLVIREQEYSMAARAIGCSPLRVAFRHMLPNSLSPVIVAATFLVPRAIFAEAALSFIGIGVAPPAPSLGSLINDHFGFVGIQWVALAIPTIVLAVIFLAFQAFGDGLRDALDPRTSP